VKKTLVVMLAIVAVAAAGCKKKEEAPKAMAPEAAPAGQAPAVAPGTDPHAGLKPQEIKPGAGHKGKVLETMDSGGYTYVQVDENGQKLWVAVMQTKVKVGDTVEFPDSPPMVNFQSKTLKRTFEKIIFAPGLAVNK
jgi:nitrous oxide reductase accessory protein NosL